MSASSQAVITTGDSGHAVDEHDPVSGLAPIVAPLRFGR